MLTLWYVVKMKRFWAWYEKYYAWNVGLTLVLFLWQLVHLYWLGADVIATRLTGVGGDFD